MTALIGVERCSRCFAPIEENETTYIDLYGAPVCQACHVAEWNPAEQDGEWY